MDDARSAAGDIHIQVGCGIVPTLVQCFPGQDPQEETITMDGPEARHDNEEKGLNEL